MSNLVYVDDDLPGITRRGHGTGWSYAGPDGKNISDRAEIDRLNALGVPPAWRDVWLCPSANGHIQATGYDDKGRKQYRYHEDFRAQREAEKYEQCAAFGRKLPLIRARVAADMEDKALYRDTVLASVVRLLDLGKVRIGNRRYTKDNKSFGATTLRERHVDVGRRRIKFEFRAKSGKRRRLTVNDRSLAEIVRKCQDLPGQALFQYLDSDGEHRTVGSSDVNAYIRDAMGTDFTAKHFRTWGASARAFESLAEAGAEPITLTDMLEPVAAMLGNTPAVTRNSYVHPRLVELCKSGAPDYFAERTLPRKTRYLSRYERGLIELLDNPAN